MPIAETRLIIVCTDAVKAQMNNMLNKIDPASSGDVLTAGLALPETPEVIVGWWTSWAMTNDQKGLVLQSYAQQGWQPLKGSERDVLQPGDVVPAWGTQRFWSFDGTTWVRVYDVLDRLGLVPVWTES